MTFTHIIYPIQTMETILTPLTSSAGLNTTVHLLVVIAMLTMKLSIEFLQFAYYFRACAICFRLPPGHSHSYI